MSFFSKIIKPYRKGERNFDRGRQAEFRRDPTAAKAYFEKAATAFDEHIAAKQAAGKEVRPSHLVMAGISYTRAGRYEDAVRVLDECMARKEIPDAFLHAGFSAARLGDADKAAQYWEKYPAWTGQRVIANVLREQIKAIRQEKPDLQKASEAVTEAIFKQDIENNRNAKTGPHQYKKGLPVNRGY